MTLVFRLYSRIPGGGFRGTRLQRANIICECTNIVKKMKAKEIVRDSKKHHIDASSLEKALLPPGHDVLVYQEKKG